MKKLAVAFLASTLCLFAAEFWLSKPSNDWSDKDLQKMISNSPWAKPIGVSLSGPLPPSLGGAPGGGGGDEGPSAPISEGGGGGRGGGRGGGGGGGARGGASDAGGRSTDIVARWQTALPIKQALAGLKRGVAEEDENSYVIVLAGALRPFLRGNPETLKQTVIDATSLSAKGKAANKPSDVKLNASRAGVEIAFYFPRSEAYSLDDKEVEFATKLSDLPLKYKFRLKDMVYNGKLEM